VTLDRASSPLLLIGLAVVVPARSEANLNRLAAWLTRYGRALVIVLFLVFGTWLFIKGLVGIGVL